MMKIQEVAREEVVKFCSGVLDFWRVEGVPENADTIKNVSNSFVSYLSKEILKDSCLEEVFPEDSVAHEKALDYISRRIESHYEDYENEFVACLARFDLIG